jgi:hypothetical protein
MANPAQVVCLDLSLLAVRHRLALVYDLEIMRPPESAGTVRVCATKLRFMGEPLPPSPSKQSGKRNK